MRAEVCVKTMQSKAIEFRGQSQRAPYEVAL